MSAPKLVSKEASIVLLGSFNPPIFQPEWFARHEVIPTTDVESAEIEIIHREVAQFKLHWVNIQVVQNRFIARTNDPAQFSPLRDLVISTFSILDHTPIKQLVMNLTLEFDVDNEEIWHKIGDTLAPKQIWEKSLPKRVGLTKLTVRSPRKDKLNGELNITVEPSKKIKYGVQFVINNHFNIDDDTTTLEILPRLWDNTIEQSEEIADVTIKEAMK